MRTFIGLVSLVLGMASVVEAQPAPRVSLSPLVIQEGQTVAMTASGFTPSAHVLMHLVRPDGSEYPEMQLTADARGAIAHTIRIILIQLGTYELQAVDLSSKAVATSRFMVVEGTLPPTGPPQSNRTPPPYVGVWQGSIARPGVSPRQPVLVTLSGGETGAVVGTIAYPGLSCGGELWLLTVAADSVHLGEQITYGEERCTTHGILTVKPAGDGGLEIQRREAEQPSALPASGTLPRRQ
jgi:hypothetical protein